MQTTNWWTYKLNLMKLLLLFFHFNPVTVSKSLVCAKWHHTALFSNITTILFVLQGIAQEWETNMDAIKVSALDLYYRKSYINMFEKCLKVLVDASI